MEATETHCGFAMCMLCDPDPSIYATWYSDYTRRQLEKFEVTYDPTIVF